MTYIPSSATVIQRVPKSDAAPHGAITVTNIPVDAPAFVAFGGELTVNAHGANSYAKILQHALAENGVFGINIYSVAYKFGSRNPGLERTEQFKIAGRRLRHNAIVQDKNEQILKEMRENEPVANYVRQLFDVLLRPRIVDASGHRINPDMAMKNLQRIKFFAHCHGASVIWQMGNLMADEMLKLGYSATDARDIQHELVVIQHSPIAPLTKQRFNTISFASAEDTMMQNHHNLFADWMYENSADIVPCFFETEYGNVFIGGHLKELSFKEHNLTGLLKSDNEKWPLTADGEIIFGAERNALARAAQSAINGTTVMSVNQLVDGNGIDTDVLRRNGQMLYNIMLNDIRQQRKVRGHQK